MTSTTLLTDAQRRLESCSASGLTVLDFEIVDDVAELTLAFTSEALERVVQAQLHATGVPSDWADPDSPMDAGSPTWAYALELAELFNEHYLKQLVYERHESVLESVLADHGHEGTPIVARPAYSPTCLVFVLRRLKAAQRHSPSGAASATNAA